MVRNSKPKLMMGSAATPTETERAAFEKLTPEEKRIFLDSELKKGLKSGVSEKSMDELWEEAKREAEASENAL